MYCVSDYAFLSPVCLPYCCCMCVIPGVSLRVVVFLSLLLSFSVSFFIFSRHHHHCLRRKLLFVALSTLSAFTDFLHIMWNPERKTITKVLYCVASVSESDNKTEHVSERIQNCQLWIAEYNNSVAFCSCCCCCCFCRLVSPFFIAFVNVCLFVYQSYVFFWKTLCRPRNWHTQHCMQSNAEMAPKKNKKKNEEK